MIKKIKKILLYLGLIGITFSISGTIFNFFNKEEKSVYHKNIKKNNKQITNINEVKTLEQLHSIDPSIIAKLPKYDSRNFNIVPRRVDNQGVMPICWAYSVAAASEISILKSKIGSFNYFDDSFNLDEKNIDYVTNIRTIEADKLGLTLYDQKNNPLRQGNYPSVAAMSLTQQNGLTLVSENKSDSYGAPIAFLKNIVNMGSSEFLSIDLIKQAIVKYGSLVISYDSKGQHISQTNFNSKKTHNGSSEPHAVTIVGWNDEISKDVFNKNASIDGAWIVRNSWGPHSGHNGYFELSYDSPLNVLMALDYEQINKSYENQYYYDGLSGVSYNGKNKAAAIFPVKKASYNKKEKIKAIRVGIKGKDVEVIAKIYKNVKANEFDRFSSQNDPTNGQLIQTKESFHEFSGFYTIDLDQEIEIQNGEYFSIVVEVSNKTNDAAIAFSYEPHSLNDMTYYFENNKWINCYIPGNSVARIRALTTTEDISNTSLDKNLKWANISLEEKNYINSNIYRYNGAIKPKPVVKFDNQILVENRDYTIKWEELKLNFEKTPNSDDDLIGYGVINIEGINEYKGNNKIHYPVKVALLPDLKNLGNIIENNKIIITIQPHIKKYKEIKLPDGWLWINDKAKNIQLNDSVYISYNGKDKNGYRINFLNVTLNKEKENKKTTINQQNLSDAIINIKEQNFEYTSHEIKPEIEIYSKDKEILKQNKDYVIKYENNVNASNQAKIIITGINNFKGTKEQLFTIQKAKNIINNFYIDSRTKRPNAQSKFGQVKYLYFSDKECKNKLPHVPDINGIYYVKAFVENSKNWNYIESSEILEFQISVNDIPKNFIDKNENHNDSNSLENNMKIKKNNNKFNITLWISILLTILLIVGSGIIVLFFKKKKNEMK